MTTEALPMPGLRVSEVTLATAVVFVVALLVLPLPAPALDLFLALSIASSLIVLLVALQTKDPLEFNVFPAVLLLLTLYRLALNVSSTRLILGRGEAGKVIESFGAFVVGGNFVVGLVIFLILIAINFIVITKGAGRVAEVAARFTLDAMPGRQMSIDGDLSAGLIDDGEARRRRDEISAEADFYGAMDGAAKFVRGDAIAGLLITGINLLGGVYIGLVERGMTLDRAISEYSVLTVGDGLVTQIPALIISTSAGIMVTSAAGGTRIADALVEQVGGQPRSMWIASVLLGGLAIVPGLPALPFLALSGVVALGARGADRKARESAAAELEALPPEPAAEPTDAVHELLQVDPVEMEVGYGLIPLIDERGDGDLLQRIGVLRKQAALELGFLVPPIRIRDDARLGVAEYLIRIRGSEAGRHQIMPRMVLALDTGAVTSEVEGMETTDPSFGLPARWIQPALREEAEAAGYVVVEPGTVIATHLMETLKANAADLLGREDVQRMIDALAETHPTLASEVGPERVPIGVLHRVLQRLLRERVPIRDLVTIVETLADSVGQTKDPEHLAEQVRHALGKQIADLFADDEGRIRGVVVGPRLETALMRLFNPRAATDAGLAIDPAKLTSALGRLEALVRTEGDSDLLPVISPPGLRVGIRRLIEPVLPAVPVVSLAELPPQITVLSDATWELPDEDR